MSFPRYEHYKDSGVEWLGEVPGHWEFFEGRRIFGNRREQALDTDEQLAASQKYGVIPQTVMMELNDSKVMLALKGTDSFRHVETNDFVISLRSFEGGIEHSNYRGCVSPAYTVLSSSKDIEPNFFRFLFKSLAYVSALQSTTDSLRDGKSITYQQFASIPLPSPPRSEQQTIAAFLDRETAKIDALITEQQRLVELLKEKRQAVISHAVTKGLNPEAKMKDSGIEWLGEVPENWQVKRLRFIADVQSGVAKGKDNSRYETIEVPYLRVANVQDGYLDLETVTTIGIPASDLDRYRLRIGDVLMNEGGDYDKLGRGHIWNGEIDPCIHQNHVFAVRPKAVSSQWLNEITGCDYAQFYFMTRSKQSTNLASISSTNIMELPVVLPPLAEQQEILVTVSEQRTRFDTLTAETNRAITLLQERRTALISAAVTGKIDVRGLAATPSEVDHAA